MQGFGVGKWLGVGTPLVVLTAAPAVAQSRGSDAWSRIGPSAFGGDAIPLPVQGRSGPAVLGVQVLLDRALFSPGIIDGRWGKNTAKAVRWFQEREGLAGTGKVTPSTLRRLREVASSDALVRTHTLTSEDVSGPFVDIPEDIYAKAEMECMCYESLAEKLGEMFHTSPAVLRQLNPGTNLDALSAGDRITVPAVRDGGVDRGKVAKIVVSDGGHYVHGLDADGRILYHFPSTLGSQFAPSPDGKFSVNLVKWDPQWYYQPGLLTGVPDDEANAMIPPGPNNAVGVVWMDLSKEDYGIHGTSAPETIGYTTSHGCVRLTNWDARFLGERVDAGIPVEFTSG